MQAQTGVSVPQNSGPAQDREQSNSLSVDLCGTGMSVPHILFNLGVLLLSRRQRLDHLIQQIGPAFLAHQVRRALAFVIVHLVGAVVLAIFRQ